MSIEDRDLLHKCFSDIMERVPLLVLIDDNPPEVFDGEAANDGRCAVRFTLGKSVLIELQPDELDTTPAMHGFTSFLVA